VTALASAELDRTLSALADPTRRGLVDLLRREPRRAGDLAKALNVSPPALSRHLRVLRKSGLVEQGPLQDDARVRVYRLRRERFAALHDWLDQVESFWNDQLASFMAHAESTRKAKLR
jgi:DNA-binding transcriptional ArsR family regulator